MTEGLLNDIASRKEPMLAFLEHLVLENSYTENVAGGVAVGELFAKALKEIGLSVRSVPSVKFAHHWVACSEAAQASATGAIALIGHLDTVFPKGTFEGFSVEGAIARGPGVLDMKGGLVVIYEALRALAKRDQLQRIPLRLVVVADEEVGSPEGRPLIESVVRGADCALTFEAGRKADAIITRRKGTGSIRAIAHGKAAHAGNAHRDGANAIWALSRFVDQAQRLTDYGLGITVNAGKIVGGMSKNTVPDAAEALFDFRFERRVDGEALLQKLADGANVACREVPGTSIVLEGGIAREPLERTSESARLFEAYGLCARDVGLGFSEAPLIGGGSDASTTSALGIPSIDGLGPRGSGFHTREELIETDSLVPKTQALALFLQNRSSR